MRLNNKKSGFTLLEIIIVIIIVGVLASLALPRLFNTIEYSRSTEALNVVGTLKRGVDRCAMAAEAITGALDYSVCTTWAQIGTDDPGCSGGRVAGALFDYTVAEAAGTVTIVAQRVDPAAACANIVPPTGGAITFTYNTAAGTSTRAGTGPYSSLQ